MWRQWRATCNSLLSRLSCVVQNSTYSRLRTWPEELESQSQRNRAKIADVVHQFQYRIGDTGSTPVQVAVLTYRIRHLTEHMKNNRKDYSCQRSLVKMVHQRRRLLQYLERTDHKTYLSLLSQLQLRTPKPQPYSRI